MTAAQGCRHPQSRRPADPLPELVGRGRCGHPFRPEVREPAAGHRRPHPATAFRKRRYARSGTFEERARERATSAHHRTPGAIAFCRRERNQFAGHYRVSGGPILCGTYCTPERRQEYAECLRHYNQLNPLCFSFIALKAQQNQATRSILGCESRAPLSACDGNRVTVELSVYVGGLDGISISVTPTEHTQSVAICQESGSLANRQV